MFLGLPAGLPWGIDAPMNVPRLAVLTVTSLVALVGVAGAQLLPPQNIPGGAPPPGVQGPRPMYDQPGSQACVRLEASLAQLDSAATGGANPEQTRRYEEAIQRQRFELDQTIVQAKRLGCDTGGGFFLFGNTRPPQCDGLNNQIGRMRNNLERMISELGNLRGGSTDLNRDLQRRQLVSQLAQNNCGPQYRQAAPQPQRPRGLLEALFGSGLREESTIDQAPLDMPMAGTYRTLCVRTCDGFFFPISFATTRSQFQSDEARCQALCPGTEAKLFAYSNPGAGPEQMTGMDGRPYADMPTAFRYRTSFDASCTCKSGSPTIATNVPGGGARVDITETIPPIPDPRPAPGEDPETIANRVGGFSFGRTQVAVAQAPSARPDGKEVRVVGPAYWDAPEQEGVVIAPVPN